MGYKPPLPPPPSVGLYAHVAYETAVTLVSELVEEDYQPMCWYMARDTFDTLAFSTNRTSPRIEDVTYLGLPIYEDNGIPKDRLRLEGVLLPPAPPQAPSYQTVWK